MKSNNRIFGVLFLVLLAGSICADTAKVFSSFKITSKGQDDNWHPVVGINKGKPVILTDDGLQEAKISWTRAARTKAVNDQWIDILSIIEIQDPNSIVLDVQLKSSDALSDAYAVLSFLMHREDGTTSPASKLANLPALTGDVQSVRVRFPKSNVRDGEWHLHVYQTGLELYDRNRTDLEDATPEQAFALNFRRHLIVTGSGDANPAPFYMPVKKPDELLLPPTAGVYIVKVKVTIGRDGKVSDYGFLDELNPKLQEHLSASINQWLFFPEIKAGKIIERSVVVPLQLR